MKKCYHISLGDPNGIVGKLLLCFGGAVLGMIYQQVDHIKSVHNYNHPLRLFKRVHNLKRRFI